MKKKKIQLNNREERKKNFRSSDNEIKIIVKSFVHSGEKLKYSLENSPEGGENFLYFPIKSHRNFSLNYSNSLIFIKTFRAVYSLARHAEICQTHSHIRFSFILLVMGNFFAVFYILNTLSGFQLLITHLMIICIHPFSARYVCVGMVRERKFHHYRRHHHSFPLSHHN